MLATTFKLENAQDDTQRISSRRDGVRLGQCESESRFATCASPRSARGLVLTSCRVARAQASRWSRIKWSVDRIGRCRRRGSHDVAGTAGGDERMVAAGGEIWLRGRRVGVRGGGGFNTPSLAARRLGRLGDVVPYPRLNFDGAVTRGSDSTRDRWSLGVRLTF